MKSPVVATELNEQEWHLFGAFLREQESARLLSIAAAPLSDADQARMEAFFQENEINHRNLINPCQDSPDLPKSADKDSLHPGTTSLFPAL